MVLMTSGFGCSNRINNITCDISKNGYKVGNIDFKLNPKNKNSKAFIKFKGRNTVSSAYIEEDDRKYDIEVNDDFLGNSAERWITFRIRKNNLRNPRVIIAYKDYGDDSTYSGIPSPYDFSCSNN